MPPGKISPELKLAVEDYNLTGHDGLSPHAASIGVVTETNSRKPPRSVVFIHCDDNANFDQLASLGVRVNRKNGKVRTAFLPLAQLERVAELESVYRIEPSRYLKPLMDIAKPRVNLPIVFSHAELTGKGVIVGVIDTGIDPSHPAFDGRIRRIWDQTVDGPGVAEGGYGLELEGSLLTASRDRDGHGTHVAGMAAGADKLYAGVASEAELVIVKTSFQDAHIANAVEYIFRVAEEVGCPAVVNLSLGGHYGPHDGTDSLSQAIEQETGPGRIVVCSAGNEGVDNIHAQAIVGSGQTVDVSFRIFAPSGAQIGPDRAIILNGWYSGQDELEIAIESPAGFMTGFQAVKPNDPIKSYSNPEGRIDVSTEGPSPLNNDHNFFVVIRPPSTLLASSITTGIWRLHLRGVTANDIQADVWLIDRSDRTDALFLPPHVQNSMTIGSPGSAAGVLTVGSYTTRVNWTDADGNSWMGGQTLDAPSGFSSEGPLRDGSAKPDLCAPGSLIAAPLSADSSPEPSMVLTTEIGLMQGTSMACPFVSGVVALLLQRNDTLDSAAAKVLLRDASAIPGQPPSAHDTKWGFGLLDCSKL